MTKDTHSEALPEDTPYTDLDALLDAAASAAGPAAAATPAERARWLSAAADALDGAADELVELAVAETHLPAAPRLRGELARTTFQLRLFGEVLADGAYLGARVDHTDPQWPMGARPDLRRVNVPLGPVLVFAASNFPFAFSVAGGDTASALAAGCPVILKAHPGHPGLSDLTGSVVREALLGAGAPAGIFEVIHGVDTGVVALRDARIAAAAFTGSVAGGRALFDIACGRPSPIPFYGELGSVNPVVVTPGAVAARGAEIAQGFAGSFTLGTGQFCTKPGLLLLPASHGLDEELREAVRATAAQPMLNERIAEGFAARLTELRAAEGVTELATGQPAALDGPDGAEPVPAALLQVTATDFLRAGDITRHECFGPSSLVVTYADASELQALLDGLEPGLTATLHAEESEADQVRAVLPALTRIAGRVLWNEWPTGVSVTWAQQHGGPYPATTAPTTTSVGTEAITRFLRPVAYQNFPDPLLPAPLRESNPWHLPRRTDGKPT